MSSKEPTIANLEDPAQEELVGLQAEKLQRVIHNVRLRPPKKNGRLRIWVTLIFYGNKLREKFTLDEYSSKTFKTFGC